MICPDEGRVKGTGLRGGMRLRLGLGVGAAVGLAAALLWLRPWADAVMRVKITVRTDGEGLVAIYGARKFFSSKGRQLPEVRGEVSLANWAGQLARLDIEGEVGRRMPGSGATGYVACAAELLGPEGERPLEFISWQQGLEIGAHTRPLGPLACKVEDDREGSFAFARKGTLWHVLRVPERARLRVWLKPVLAESLTRVPEPYVARNRSERPTRLPARHPGRMPDVFIYVIDALRADHVGCYGYKRDTSPTIDAFSAEGVLFEEAYTASTWTRPSVATMLSGLYPTVHGVIHYSDGLAEWPVLLPEMLRQAGYHTRGFVANATLAAAFGLDQGYSEYVFRQAPATWINRMVGDRLAAEDPKRPVFMYLHTVEPHGPYTPSADSFKRFDRGIKGRCDGSLEALDKLGVLHPDLSRADVEHLYDLYDAKVYEADQGFAGFLAALKAAGRYENSVIILTADHGEAFDEHDTLGHAWELSQEDMRVPLVIKFPQRRHAGVRVKERASLVDVTPTILSEVGLKPKLPYELPGRDLSLAALQPDSGPSRRIYAEVSRWDSNDLDLVAVIEEDGYKRVIDVSVPPRETATRKSLGLWDTRADPKEEHDLLKELPVRAAYGEQLIAGWLLEQRDWRKSLAASPPPKVEFDEVLRRQLQAMGYLKGRPLAPK